MNREENLMMDTKFSVALHILAIISESKEVLSSQALTESVGTNASYIRKVIALLKNVGLITSQQGRSGYQLSKSTSEFYPVAHTKSQKIGVEPIIVDRPSNPTSRSAVLTTRLVTPC